MRRHPAGQRAKRRSRSRADRARTCRRQVPGRWRRAALGRGVTYGTFAEGHDGHRFGQPGQVDLDFAAMAAHGINAVRTYTAPPRHVLDAALRHGLRVMVGLSWEQHVAFLGDRGRAGSIIERVREQAALCAGHPAILSFAVGNEIPTPIVRWRGMYVQTRSGWFSERSICYLASGRPVLAQDTGLEGLYPLGEGLLAFRTVDDAAGGVEEICSDYARHSRAARDFAEAYFDSDHVLGRLLGSLGVA